MLRGKPPIGVILAGGRGSRMGGAKLVVNLQGRPLIEYPLKAMAAALADVAVIAKRDVELRDLGGVTLWIEPDEPRHPLLGIVEALALADGRPVVVCPADLPFVTPALFSRLARTPRAGTVAVVAASARDIQPLLGCYQAGAAQPLAIALRAKMSVRDAVAALGARHLEVEDPCELFNVNTPDDLLQASAMLGSLPRDSQQGSVREPQ
jgi:molybdopterin-guanine dinucleotide biosynthesis protein A